MSRNLRFAIFFAIIILGYGTLSALLFHWAWVRLAGEPLLRVAFAVGFWTATPLFLVARVWERFSKGVAARSVLWAGSFWLAVFVYAGFLGIAAQLASLAFAPAGLPPQGGPATVAVVFGFALLFALLGWRNARHPKVRRLEYAFPAGKGTPREFHIVAATDVHLGTLIGKQRFDGFVRQIDRLKPDAVFFVGDTIDEDIEPVIRQDIGTSFLKLHAPLGVFAVNGNHEHIGGVERADHYLEAHGVRVLRDESVVVDGGFNLVGREDISSGAISGTPRKALSVLLQDTDPDLPVILLDHQPAAIREAVDTRRVALQLSGHTHHGQLWPFSLVTKRIFEISWGGRKIGDTEFYVSSGWGTWGPPVRTGNSPELLDIRLRFE